MGKWLCRWKQIRFTAVVLLTFVGGNFGSWSNKIEISRFQEIFFIVFPVNNLKILVCRILEDIMNLKYLFFKGNSSAIKSPVFNLIYLDQSPAFVTFWWYHYVMRKLDFLTISNFSSRSVFSDSDSSYLYSSNHDRIGAKVLLKKFLAAHYREFICGGKCCLGQSVTNIDTNSKLLIGHQTLEDTVGIWKLKLSYS